MRTSLLILLLWLVETPALAQASSIGINGLRTGMTIEELNALVRTSRWGYLELVEQNDPIDSTYKEVLLGAEGHSVAESGNILADAKGSRERTLDPFSRFPCPLKECPALDLVIAEIREGRVARLTIFSEPFTPGDIKGIERWALAADTTLRAHFGPPTMTVSGAGLVKEKTREITALKPGRSTMLATWAISSSGGKPLLAIDIGVESIDSEPKGKPHSVVVIRVEDMQIGVR